MTWPKIVLWRALKDRPGGLRFRHQHPAGPYALNFFCPRYKLAVEVDGEAHGRGDRPARDSVRDAWIAAQRVRTPRVVDVLADLDAVVRQIVHTAAGPGRELPLHHRPKRAGGPPPPPGED